MDVSFLLLVGSWGSWVGSLGGMAEELTEGSTTEPGREREGTDVTDMW